MRDNEQCVSEGDWVIFDNDRDEEDQTVHSFQPDEGRGQEPEEEEEEEEEGTSGDKSSRPERPPPPADYQQKTRDEIAMERALAKYSAQLEKGLTSLIRTLSVATSNLQQYFVKF